MMKILIADDHAIVRKGLVQILQEEFNRAHEIIDTMWKTFHRQYHNTNNNNNNKKNKSGTGKTDPTNTSTESIIVQWEKLFEPSDFFISYPVSCCCCCCCFSF